MEDIAALLMKSADAVEAELMCGVLEKEGIPYYCKNRGAGNMYCGGAVMGVDVYVSEMDIDIALELMDGLFGGADDGKGSVE